MVIKNTMINFNQVIFFSDCVAYLSSQIVEINLHPIIRAKVDQWKLSTLINKNYSTFHFFRVIVLVKE